VRAGRRRQEQEEDGNERRQPLAAGAEPRDAGERDARGPERGRLRGGVHPVIDAREPEQADRPDGEEGGADEREQDHERGPDRPHRGSGRLDGQGDEPSGRRVERRESRHSTISPSVT
jgi:hypothetical protein